MSIITKKNHTKAITSNAETIATSAGFLEAAAECQEILKAEGMTDEEKFDLIDHADDLTRKEFRRAACDFRDDTEDSVSGMVAMMRMADDAISSDDVDFTSEQGFNLGRLEGKKRAYRKVLSWLRVWKDEKDRAQAFQMMEHAVNTTSSLLSFWTNYNGKQGKIAEARLKELKEMTFA